MDYLAAARNIFKLEIEGLQAVSEHLGDPFCQMVELCLNCARQGGKLILTGVGKSGLIGAKIAATLSSTGSPAVFLHPVEAMHGDLGVLTPHEDLLICLSYSGETDELLAVLPAAKRFEIPIVAITAKNGSSLGDWSDLVVPMAVPGEACPFNLAPTTSTTALLALGDALAMVLMQAKGFSREDYGLRHPSGAIGRSITMRIRDIMRRADRVPTVNPQTTVHDALMEMTRRRSGSVIVVDDQHHLLGIFTDGDFRRHAANNLDLLQLPINRFMTSSPIHIREDQMAIEVLNLLEKREIDDIPVVDAQQKVVGLVDIQDLPKFKLM